MKIATLSANAILAVVIGAVLLPAIIGWPSTAADQQPPSLTTITSLAQEQLPPAQNNNSRVATQTPVPTSTPRITTGTLIPTPPLKRAPFFKPPVKPVDIVQLKPRQFDPDLMVTFFPSPDGQTFNLLGQPAHILTLSLVVQVDRKELATSVELAEKALANYLTGYLINRTYEDVHQTSEMLKLKEITLLFLNDYLPAGGVRAVYFNIYLLR